MRRDGFTLIELMVAMTCAGIVALVALGVWKNLYGNYAWLLKNYQACSSDFLQDLEQIKKRVVTKPDPNIIQIRY